MKVWLKAVFALCLMVWGVAPVSAQTIFLMPQTNRAPTGPQSGPFSGGLFGPGVMGPGLSPGVVPPGGYGGLLSGQVVQPQGNQTGVSTEWETGHQTAFLAYQQYFMNNGNTGLGFSPNAGGPGATRSFAQTPGSTVFQSPLGSRPARGSGQSSGTGR